MMEVRQPSPVEIEKASIGMEIDALAKSINALVKQLGSALKPAAEEAKTALPGISGCSELAGFLQSVVVDLASLRKIVDDTTKKLEL